MITKTKKEQLKSLLERLEVFNRNFVNFIGATTCS